MIRPQGAREEEIARFSLSVQILSSSLQVTEYTMAATPTSGSGTSTTTERILFYHRQDPYYEFTNFFASKIFLDGFSWPTTEHYFQAAKFDDADLKRQIRECGGPGKAAEMGRNKAYSKLLRKDWDTYRLEAMMIALRAKFTQHAELKKLLLSTGEAELVEDSPKDSFWGIGPLGDGKNQLGVLLMKLRAELAEQANAPSSSL